jgi:hypothetical protein
VLVRDDRAEQFLDEARTSSTNNPMATAITARATALLTADHQALIRIADDFERAGATYQQRRTRTLADFGPHGSFAGRTPAPPQSHDY